MQNAPIQSSRSFPRIKVSVVTIGMFDGVHVGHSKILRAVVRDARALCAEAVVFTFAQHPQSVMGHREGFAMITTTSQRLRLFRNLGISRTLVCDFNARFAKTAPAAFVKRFLLDRLGMKELCVGYDFAFGKDRKGNVALLKQLSHRNGFKLRVFGPFRGEGAVVSSTSIRKLLQQGKLKRARRLLGRPYCMEGFVERGMGLGRVLGFPTANIRMDNDCLLPNGVYAVTASGPGFCRPGVLNAGYRPTLKERGSRVGKTWELHLWDFDKDLYGKRLEVRFIKRLRPEKKFESLEALTRQVRKDIAVAKAISSS